MSSNTLDVSTVENTQYSCVALDDLCEKYPGIRNPTATPEVPFTYVDITAVDNVSKRITESRTLLGKEAPSRARNIIRSGDVIVATTRPNLNAVALVPAELDNQICSTGFCVLRPSSALLSDYLFLFVQSQEFVDPLADLVKGALYPAVTDHQVRSQQIPLVPLAEQKRIAVELSAALAAVDTARRAAQERLAAAKDLTAAYLKATFVGTEVEQWKTHRIDNIAKTCSGSTPSRGKPEYFGGNISWVKTGELKDNVIGINDSIEEKVTELALRECSLPLLPAGTLLVAMYGQGQTRGRTALLGCDATTNQACFAVLPNLERFSSEYLQLWFRANYQTLRAMTENRGGNQPNLNGVLLRRLEVPLPPVPIQRRIVAKLSQKLAANEQLILRLREELAAIESLPAALLRRAFNHH